MEKKKMADKYYECVIDIDMLSVEYREYIVDEEKDEGFWLEDLEDGNVFFYSRLDMDGYCGTTKEEALDKFINACKERAEKDKKRIEWLEKLRKKEGCKDEST
jgi:hypothetical protein